MKWIFWGRDEEKEVIDLIVKHVQTASLTMDAFNSLMESLETSRFDEVERCGQVIKDHERSCDSLRHKINEALFAGAFLPMMRSQLYRLTDQIDTVADTIDNASHMAVYFRVHKLDKTTLTLLRRLSAEADRSVRLLEVVLRSMLDRESDEEFREKYHRMKIAEEACDHIQKELFDLLYKDKKRHPTYVLLVGTFGHTLSSIADAVEVASDTLSAIKMLRHA